MLDWDYSIPQDTCGDCIYFSKCVIPRYVEVGTNACDEFKKCET